MGAVTSSLPAAEQFPVPGPQSSSLSPARILWRQKWAVAAIAAVLTALAWLYSVIQSPVYEAQATLEVQELNQEFLNVREFNPIGDAGSRFGALTDIQTQIRILQSETLLDQAAQSIHLGPAPQSVTERNIWLRKLVDQVQIRSPGVTRIVEIVVDQDNPRTAAELANALSREYITRNVAARTAISNRTAALLTQQLEDMRQRLEQSEDALQRYARETGLVITTDKQNIGDQKLREIETELSRAESERAAKQSHWEVFSKARPEALPELMDDREYRDVGFRLEDMKAQEAQLDATFQKDYRKNVQIHAGVVSLQNEQIARRAEVLDRIHTEFLDSQHREQLLRDQYVQQSRVVMKDNENAIRYNLLRRDVDANAELYESLRQKVKQSDFARAVPSGNVRVLDYARPPQKPIRPRTLINVIGGFLGGLVFGAAYAVLRERSDKTFREPGALSPVLGEPEMGAIPRKTKSNANAVAEAGRGLAASVIFAGTEIQTRQHAHSIYVVTSAGPGEGKTTVTGDLAVALAESRLNVLIIDADLRKPSIHERFGVAAARGLTDLLKTTEPSQDYISSFIVKAGVARLSILPSGTAGASGEELLGSPALGPILAYVRAHYDVVLIDTPPVLVLPSARLAGRLADAAIVIVRAGKTSRNAALHACERLHSDEIAIAGIVLNDLAPEFAPYGSYEHRKKRL
jgi:capsular exopolysaccharide synthesis family protein